MMIQTSSTAVRGHDMQADDRRAQLAAMLDDADPTARERRDSLLHVGYDLIVQALARKLPQKMILVALKEAYGLKLHPVRFRELLEAETDAASSRVTPCAARSAATPSCRRSVWLCWTCCPACRATPRERRARHEHDSG